MDTSFKSPVQKKDIPTINNSGYNESDDQVDKLSDSKEQVETSIRSKTDSVKHVDASISSSTDSTKQVDPKSDPKSDPSSDPRVARHITKGIKNLLVSQIPVSFETVVIRQHLVMSVEKTPPEGLLQESLKPPQTINLKEIVTDAVSNSAQVERISRTPSGTRRAIRHSPRVNVEVFSPSRFSHSIITKSSGGHRAIQHFH